MAQLQQLWNRLIGTQSAHDGTAQQAYVTRVVLTLMSLTLLVFSLPVAILSLIEPIDLDTILIILFLDLPVWGGWWIARRGRWQLASHIPPAVLLGLAIYATYTTASYSIAGLLFSVVAVLVTGILHGSRLQWAMVLLSSVSYLAVGSVRGEHNLFDAISTGITVTGSLAGIALLHWFSNDLVCRATEQARLSAAELQTSASMMRTLFESATDSIVFTDVEGNIVDANPAALHLHKLDSKEALHDRNIFEFVVPEERDAAREGFQRVLATGSGNVVEYKLLTIDQRTFDGELSNVTYGDQQGNPAGSIIITRDISARKQAEEALRDSEQRYRSIIEASPMGMFIYRLDDKDRLIFTDANPAADQILGVDNRQFIGKTIEEAFPPLAETEVPKRYRLAAAEGTSWQTMQMTYRDAQIAGYFEVYAFQTAPRTMAVAFWDVTERVRREEERVRLTTAIEQSAEHIVITDTEGIILYVNPAFERATGYAREEAIGQNPRILNSGNQTTAFYRELWETISSGNVWHGRLVNRKKDGALYTEDATISPVRAPDGQIINYVAVKRDISEELDLQERYYQSQKMEAIGRLASGIAHDFNNLLTAITGYTRLLMDDLLSDNPQDWPPGPTVRADLQEVLRAGDQAGALTQQLLAFCRKQVQQLQVLDLNSVLEDMLPMLQRLIGENIALRTELGSHLGYARADRSQLEQVIMNLTVNARDAMPDGGQLLFRTSCCTVPPDVPDSVELGPGEYVMLAVSDTGTGMSSEVQSHIFEPFFTTKGEGLGTGLGLSTVYGIVEQSGGVIEVESALGQGTTFVVYLPQAERAAPVIHAPEEQSISEGSETILLVEDEDRVRTLAARMLKQQGYTLLTASNAQEAIEICSGHSHPIDLLLTDVIMPGENGVELARKIQAQHEGIRVLYISGYTDDTIGNKGAFEPGVTLLQKPFSPAELAGMVREVLDAP